MEPSTDPEAYERINVDRTGPRSRWSWRIDIQGQPARKLELSRDEILALRDHLNEIFS